MFLAKSAYVLLQVKDLNLIVYSSEVFPQFILATLVIHYQRTEGF